MALADGMFGNKVDLLTPLIDSWKKACHSLRGKKFNKERQELNLSMVRRLNACGYQEHEISGLTELSINEIKALLTTKVGTNDILSLGLADRTKLLAKRLMESSEFRVAILRDCVQSGFGLFQALDKLREEDKFKLDMLQSLELLPKTSTSNVAIKNTSVFEQIIYQLDKHVESNQLENGDMRALPPTFIDAIDSTVDAAEDTDE